MNNYTSYKETYKAILHKETTCAKIVENYLQRISNKNHEINAFVEVFSEEARQRAQQIDKKFTEGNFGKLAGMVIGIKDNICIANHKVSAASKILRGFESLYNATAVEKLLAEDAIIIGRLNCDEFAMGSSNENSIYNAVKNPHNTKKVPGGSPRKGILGLDTTRGDRLFVSLLGSAFIHLAWLGLVGSVLWIASIICVAYFVVVFKYV